MKLSESIDLFRRRFRFTAIDDGVNFVCVELKDNKTTFYVDVAANTSESEVTRIQTAYIRTLEDINNVAVKVIPHERWRHRKDLKLIWTKEGLATAAPKA